MCGNSVKPLMRLWWLGIGSVIGVGLALMMFWKASSIASPVIINGTAVPPVPTPNSEQTARGATLYAQNCASCHGPNLEGQPNWKERLPDGSLPAPPHNDSGHTWHHADKVLVDITTSGGQAVYGSDNFTSNMPAFGETLSDSDIAAILEFIKTQWGKDQRERQWWVTVTEGEP